MKKFFCRFAALIAATFSFSAAQEIGTSVPVVTSIMEPQDSYPDISPDGELIVFQSNHSGTWQLWIIKPDGTGLQRLTHSGAHDMTPVWSPDGSKIMFASDRPNATGRDFDSADSFKARDLFVMDVSGGFENAEETTTRIIENDADDMHPEWADGGSKVVFNRVYETKDGADVLVANIDGSNETTVKTDRGWNTYAAMTPNAKRIVYRGSTRETLDGETVLNSDIFSSHIDGSDRIRLNNHPGFDGWPTISPDGKTIAFASNRNGEKYHIYLMPIGGGEPRQITFGDDFHYTQPAWFSNGQTIATFRWVEDQIAEIGHIVVIKIDE